MTARDRELRRLGLIRAGATVLDTMRGELRWNGGRIALGERTVQLLAECARTPGLIVSGRDQVRAVWPPGEVRPESVASCLAHTKTRLVTALQASGAPLRLVLLARRGIVLEVLP